jgi:hypothetical protein
LPYICIKEKIFPKILEIRIMNILSWNSGSPTVRWEKSNDKKKIQPKYTTWQNLNFVFPNSV